ncbi:MAG TPA: YceI family protein [Methylococcus sp.]|nr:YceI family protein [Methylococcus sp.]
MKRERLCTLGLLAFFVSMEKAVADSYTVDPRHTFPSFEVSHLGFSTQRGRFNHTEGKIQLDPANQRGRVEISIDTASIDTGLEELEERLRKEDFFDVGHHPKIVYRAEKVRFTGDRPVAVEGEITLRGRTRPLSLNVEHFHCGLNPIYLRQVCGADATGTLRRSDFGMSAFLPLVGDEVRLHIQVEAFKD